ncbi:four helix bundle protein [Patescibacteria group bacterium]|nr:four helix bundle protein [Patescibacteria group bacterium]
MEKDNLIQKKSFDFALEIISLYKELKNQKEFIISKQVFRSATSIGANVEEALAGQSRKDFIHEMTIASKEARETRYWLNLLKESELVEINVDEQLKEINKIIGILIKIVKTSSTS